MFKHIVRQYGIVMVLIAAAGVCLFFTSPAFAATHLAQNGNQAAIPDMTSVMAPFVLLATTIERTWEAIWDTAEKAAMSGSRLLGVSADSVRWMYEELSNAQKAVNDAVVNFGGRPSDPLSQQAFATAEARLKDAQLRVQDLSKDPRYVATKRAVTIFGSLGAGLVISIASQQLTFFSAAGFHIPSWLDTILTGLVVGAGSGPVHSLIGGLQSVRDTVSAFGNLAQGTAIKNAAVSTQAAAVAAVTTEKGLVAPEGNGSGTPVAPVPPVQLQRRLETLVRSR